MIGPRYLDDTELPWDVGTHRGPDAYDARAEYDTETWTLTGLAKEYRLFTPIVLTMAGLPFDPVALCWEENDLPMSEAPYAIESPLPLLAGPPAPFTHTLFACPVPHAKTLFTFLDRMAFRNGAEVYDAVHQQVDLVDWVMLHRTNIAPAKPPLVSVALYGLAGPTNMFVWKPPADPYRDRFTLVQRSPIKLKGK